MREKVLALIEKSPGSGQFWLIDLADNTAAAFLNTPSERQLLEHNLTVFVHAKRDFSTLGFEPSPTWRVMCLSTIKKLIGKSIHETITRPDFQDAEQAVVWCKSAMAYALLHIEKQNMAFLNDLECRVIIATLAMEQKGLPFDKVLWQKSLAIFAQKNEAIKARLLDLLKVDGGFSLFGPTPIDLNNHHAVKEALEKLIGHKLKSTGQASLKEIDHEAAGLLMEYRELARMESAYGESFLAKIDDRLRGNYEPIGSASGRFSCHDPNLLALPNHEAFQACLMPKKGRSLLRFDYNACEIRILAGLSQDQALIDIFSRQEDIHSMVASKIFGQEVSKTKNAHLRDQAKVLNFGIIYGMGEQAMAAQLKISLAQAESLLKNYFKQFCKVHQYLLGLEEEARKDGFVTTALMRRGYFDADDFNPRVARNLPIQGTGADIIKLAMCRIFSALFGQGLDAAIVNVVHDEIVIETGDGDKEAVCRLVMHEMEQAFSMVVPNVPAVVNFK